MSDEKKELSKDELLRWLKNMFHSSPPLPIKTWLPIDRRAYKQIRKIIQQKPEIDDMYVNKRLNETMDSLSHLSNIMSSVVFKEIYKNVGKLIRQIISDVKGGVELTRSDIDKFILLFKTTEGEEKKIIIDRWIEYLKSAGVKIK